MDSITHLALGAVIGEAMLGKSLGKKAMLLGAVSQFCPDSDVMASLWLSTTDNLLAHRGITHSISFAVLASVVFALLAHRYYKQRSIFLTQWLLFFGLQITVHIFLDAFNAYGVGWFEPFSNQRISFNTIFVADPFFSIWILVACIALLAMNQHNPLRMRWAVLSLILTCSYLLYCTLNKFAINSEVKKILHNQHISYNRYFTTPTPFNNWLWYIVAEDNGGFYVGYRSLFDSQLNIPLEYFPKQDSLFARVDDPEALNQLIKFSHEYYTVENENDKLVFSDLRFGQRMGWINSKAPFVFTYYLQQPDENLMVIQRGRMEGWSIETIQSTIERIKGN